MNSFKLFTEMRTKKSKRVQLFHTSFIRFFNSSLPFSRGLNFLFKPLVNKDYGGYQE